MKIVGWVAFFSLALLLEAFAEPLPHVVTPAPYKGQVMTEDCETAALQMALAHEGINVSQRELMAQENVQKRGPEVNSSGRVVRWGDPDTSFVGEPNSASISTRYTSASGYGTYAPNIARLAKLFHGRVLWWGVGLTQENLQRFLSQNHPIIAWVGDRAGHMRWSPLATWRTWNGKLVVYPDPSSGVYEHAVLVVGWNSYGVLVNDPLDGARKGRNINPVVGRGWVSWKEFLAGFSTFHEMAVVLD